MKGIIDSTLREGEQTVGVLFSCQQKLDIVKRLSRIGVEEIEIGIAGVFNSNLSELIRLSRQLEKCPRLAVWCRCQERDISIAAGLKPDVLSLSIPVSDIHIEKKLGRDREWVLATLCSSITQARKSGIKKVSVGLEDATRADTMFLDGVVKTAEKHGADRIRLADTVGISTPAEIVALVKHIKKSTKMEIGVHMHNDFGMATANSIAALDVGADWADATALGLGERAGNARLEELVGYLALREKRTYRATELSALCRYVSQITGKAILSSHPIIGSDIFSCETGLHVHGLNQNPMIYEPFEPAKIGAERRLLFGSKTGRSAVKNHLAAMGFRLPANLLCEATKLVRRTAEKLGRPLQDQELSCLLSKFNG